MEKDRLGEEYSLVVIGGSAGSLEVIVKLLQDLNNDRLALIVIVHRKGSLHSALADVLDVKSRVRVKEAEEKEEIRPGFVYLAPADYHLLIEPDRTLSLDFSEKVNFSRPSIDVTFECAAQVYGNRVIGVLLSGGNADGVEGLKKIRRGGGICVVQDPATAVVSFMPQHALAEMLPDQVLSDDEMASFLNSIA